MYRILSLFIALLVIPALGCGAPEPDPNSQPREMTQQEIQVGNAANDFGFQLFREVVAESAEPNVFISPLSVSLALGMAYNGAAGTTETAMRQTLGFDQLTLSEINDAYRGLIDQLRVLDPKVKMEIANSVWYRDGFSVDSDFIQRNQTFFDAEVQGLDFAAPGAAGTINDWVADKTHNKITEIVDDPIGQELVMFLINAVYFKGTWTTEFDPADTTQQSFTTDTAGTVQVPMMNLHSDLSCLDTQDFQLVDLPYGDGYFRMAVILPRPGVDVDSVATQMDGTTWAGWMGQLTEQEADLSMPRFELEYETSLAESLKALGMGVAFDGSQADFSGINPTADLYISDVKHKTYVKVDEEGTEAAAVTSVEFGVTSVPSYFTMVVNRPFLVVIHDTHTQTMLFMGRIGDPS